MRPVHARGDEQMRLLISNFNAMADGYDDMNFTPPYLSTITARTMIIHGDRDPFFPVSIPVEMYHSIPNSALWIVPNTGHDTLGSLTGAPETGQDFYERIFDYWDQV
jgi:pimeloyl-ACP methyl ester carboxylesterase